MVINMGGGGEDKSDSSIITIYFSQKINLKFICRGLNMIDLGCTIQINVGYNDTTKTINIRNIIFIKNNQMCRS